MNKPDRWGAHPCSIEDCPAPLRSPIKPARLISLLSDCSPVRDRLELDGIDDSEEFLAVLFGHAGPIRGIDHEPGAICVENPQPVNLARSLSSNWIALAE